MAEKLTQDERNRIKLHRRVAASIPKKRQYKSLEGQTFLDFDAPAVTHIERQQAPLELPALGVAMYEPTLAVA